MTEADPTLVDLGRQLLACADDALLDAQLDGLGSQVGDPNVRELLELVYTTGQADSLREFLARDQLARWSREHATRSAQRALAAELRRLLGVGKIGPDDPARLVVLPPLPDELEALITWARRHDVLDELIRPLAEVLPDDHDWPEASVAEGCLGSFGRTRGGRAGPELYDREDVIASAREYLHACATALAAPRVRAELWMREPPEALRLLYTRLRGAAQGEISHVRFGSVRPVSIDLDSAVCRGQLQDSDALPSQARLFLAGFEHRALVGQCTCDKPGCVHVRALAARLCDACLEPSDRLHGVLCELVRVPSWQRFLRAVQPDGLGTGTASEADAPRLSFRVRLDASREFVRVGAFLHKPLADGRKTPGRLIAPHKVSRAASERDRPVLELMSASSRTLAAVFVLADLPLLRALVEHPYVELELADGAAPLRVNEQTVQFSLLEMPEGLLPKLFLGGIALSPGARRPEVSYVLAHDAGAGALVFAALTPPIRRLLAALDTFHGVLPESSFAALGPWLAGLRQVARVAAPAALRGGERATPRKLLLRITPRIEQGVDVLLCVRPFALGPLWPPGQGPVTVDGLEEGMAVHVRRDLDFERTTAEHVIDELHLGDHMRIETFGYRVETTQAALALLSDAARLHDVIDIEWAENMRRLRLTNTVRTGDLKINLRKHRHWIAVGGAAIGPDAEIAIRRVLDAVRLGERFVQVAGDDYAEIESELYARLERAQLCVLDPMREPALARSALPFWLEQLGGQTEPGDAETRGWIERLRLQPMAAAEAPPIDPAFCERLRDYQQRGVAWLLASSRWAEGVCLADEMGLGKTIQTIAFLGMRAGLGPALIIAPTSVVANWQSELARFAPELEVRLYRGAHRRERLRDLGPGHVLVSSYELVLRDRDAFEGLAFATQVVDEAQTIRNARTRRARAVAGIAAEFRVALTGTPIENRLGDLWSLFALIAPGLLGSWARFRARFAVPIERYEDTERAALLRELVAPFILRRTKLEVARELPPRTEVVHLIALSPAEQALYASAAREARRAFGRRSKHDAAPTLQILAELTRLRQLACHPRLVIDDARVSSSKLAALMQLLDDILPRGHRVLVFSQFVRHLALVREALEHAAIRFVYLDGSTPASERAGLVDKFQQGEGQVFLISLKAGGTGLNLTGADYVVHLDPWWNPAAEDQASDRAHRLGQIRPVTIVRLVAQGTIEEKVLSLHAHKRKLAEAALKSDDEPMATLDAATLESLL